MTGFTPSGLERSYPGANFAQYFNDAGREAMANAQSDCLLASVVKFPFASFEQYAATPDVIDDPAFNQVFWDASPLGLEGTPTAPVLLYHTVLDELAPRRQLL